MDVCTLASSYIGINLLYRNLLRSIVQFVIVTVVASGVFVPFGILLYSSIWLRYAYKFGW